MSGRLLLIALVTSGLSLAGCEKTNHDNIDKWTHTQKGPGKLKKAVEDEGIDADLSAHAAANLVRMGSDPEVRAAFEQMSPARRTQVIEKLAPRLWDVARIEKEDDLPGAPQITAKDALIGLRKWASDPEKQQIDTYLIDWYATISYEGRAKVGAVLGAAVMRMVGPAGGKKLMNVANQTIAAPGQEKSKNRVGDELMLGMAASGSPEAFKYVLDLVKMDSRGDETLPKRAMSQLHVAYVNPGGLFDPADPAAIVANLPALVALAKDEGQPGVIVNDAIELIRAAGMPACLEPLLSMVPYPHKDPRFKYAAAYAALHCGGTASFVQVVQALPDGAYAKDDLNGAVSGEIAKLTPRPKVLEGLRTLLDDKRPVARWVAAETLTLMKSAEDAPRIAALSGAKDKLVGFWGDQSKVDPKDRKDDPTLGMRTKDLADALTKSEAPK